MLSVDKRVLTNPFIEIKREGDTRLRAFQVLGERASGTHFVHKLLREAITLDRSNELGWKHGFPHMWSIADDMLAICVFRNAVDWSRSLHAKPWHTTAEMQKLTFSEFMRAPWQTEFGEAGFFNPDKDEHLAGRVLQLDRNPLTGEMIPNLIALRNLKTAAFLGMRHRAKNVVLVQFEHVFADPQAFVQQVCATFGLIGNDGAVVGERRLGAKFHASTADRPETPELVPADDYDFILDHIDIRQEARIGFRYLDAEGNDVLREKRRAGRAARLKST